jgi:transcriptional regulator with XRE-family HTH domain
MKNDRGRPARAPGKVTYAGIAKRLQHIQKELGFTGDQMAEAIGIQPNMWSNYKNGVRRITLDPAMRLCDVANALLRKSKSLPFDVGLDFIYCGEFLHEGKYRVKFKPRSSSK